MILNTDLSRRVLISLAILAMLSQSVAALNMSVTGGRFETVELCTWHGGVQMVRVELPGSGAPAMDHIDCLICLTGQVMATGGERQLPLSPLTGERPTIYPQQSLRLLIIPQPPSRAPPQSVLNYLT